MSRRRTPTEDIVAAYRETGSVWRAAKKLGLAGQTVHERLVATGHRLNGADWSDDELAELQNLIESGVTLGEAARRLGRTYAGAACKASRMGFKVDRRQRVVKIPRGAGFDKRSMKKHMDALEGYDGSVTQYARSQGLGIESFAQAAQRHFPERWVAYVAAHSELPHRVCIYCEGEFIPSNKRQVYCNRKCAADSRRDASYFGGRRRHAIGMATATCQLCGKVGERGLSAHHVFGKENDPNDEVLIALCQGCHQLVTHLGARNFVTDEPALESLISLAWLRKHGGKLPADHDTIHVTVQVETYADDPEELAA